MTGAGSARPGASAPRKGTAVREARNRFSVTAPDPEHLARRRLIIIRCIELLDRDRSSRRLPEPHAWLIAIGELDTGLFEGAAECIERDIAGRAGAPFKSDDASQANSRSTGQPFSRPVKKCTGRPALSRCNHRTILIALFMLT